MIDDICITAVGMATSVGLNADESCASIRAGINRFNQPDDYFFPEPDIFGDIEPVQCAPLSIIDIMEIEGSERWKALAMLALLDLFQSNRIEKKHFSKTGLLLAMPSLLRDDVDETDIYDFLPELHSEMDLPDFAIERTYPIGNSGGYMAIKEGMSLLQKNRNIDMCIIGGVDCLIDFYALKWLDANRRLKSDRNRDGFIPGEAACFFIMETMESAKRKNSKILALVERVENAWEENGIFADKPNNADGLTNAISKTVKKNKVHIEWVVCDLNGESFRAKEWGIAFARLGSVFRSLSHIHHPADCIGDVGAASGPVNFALAAKAFERGYAPSDRVLLWGSSDAGERSAAVLKRHNNKTESLKQCQQQ
ncbi:MAG: hypothetical protein PVJ19_18845 [Desulfobacteraceae bacterium]|jgi:3-oxoacyl-[acyl-carrier-protein] synthase-1